MPDLRATGPDDDIRALLTAAPLPPLAVDPDAVVSGGRRRVQRRRRVIGGASALSIVALVGAAALTLGGPGVTGSTSTDAAASVTAAAGSAAASASASGTVASAEAGDAAGARTGTVPALPEPSGSCAASSASLSADAVGAPTPYAAARSVHLGGFDASGPWREGERTATSARLYKNGVWVRTITAPKGGWVVDQTTRCSGYREPGLPAMVPETATGDSAPVAVRGASRSVRLSGDPLWPNLGVVTDGREEAYRNDPAFRVPGDDARAYRSAAGDTVLLTPVGADSAVVLQAAGGSGWGAGIEIGGLQYLAFELVPNARPGSVTAVYRVGPDGSVRSSTGESPVRAAFPGSGVASFAWFPRAGYTLLTVDGTTASGEWAGAPAWGSGGPAGLMTDRDQWTVGVLPAGAHSVGVAGAPGTTVRTKTAGDHVVVLARRPAGARATPRPTGRLRWTDAQGTRWEQPENGPAARLP